MSTPRRRPPRPGLGAPSGVISGLLPLLPGLAVVAAAVALAMAVSRQLPAVSVLTGAVLLGVAFRNLGLLHPALAPGIRFAARRLLRVGVVLLGLQLAAGEVLALGPGIVALVVAIVAVTFVGTRWMGKLLGLSRGTSLLVAAGFSICGASAVAAMGSVADAEEEEVTRAVTLVTLYGTAAMLLLPLAQVPLGLAGREYGIWAGATVHEVAQVVGAAGPVSGALAVAVVVKLTRVLMLAPMLALVSLRRRRSASSGSSRPPLVPLFVLGFMAMVTVRTTGLVPDDAVAWASTATALLLGAALFGLGTGVHLPSLVRSGGRALVLGLASTVLITFSALAGLHLVI